MQMQQFYEPTQTQDDIRAQIQTCKLEIAQYNLELYLCQFVLRSFIICLIISFILVPLSAWSTAGFLLAGVIALADLVAFFYSDRDIKSKFSIYQNRKLHQTQLRMLELALKKTGERDFQQLSFQHQYLQHVPELITSYRRKADRFRHWFTGSQLLIIVLSSLITSVSGGWLDPFIHLPWLTPLLGLLISILTGITLHFRFREKSYNLQQTADAIDSEYNAHGLAIRSYRNRNTEDALLELAERIEALREEQQKRQQQLEQSSQGEQKAMELGR